MKKHTFTNRDRFFDFLIVYFSSVSSIGTVLEGYAEERVRVSLCKDDEYLTITGNPGVTGIEFRVRPASLLKALAKNQWPQSIEIEEVAISPLTPCKHNLTNIHSIHGSIIANCFISFYEKYSYKSQASPLWSFAKVVRNGLAHNGNILIKNPTEIVKWKTLEFSYEDNGKPLLFDELTAVELIVIMIELDRELSAI